MMASKNSNNSKRSASGTSGHNKASKNSPGSSPSALATKERGFSIVNEKLRSCLRHPLAVPLIHMFTNDYKQSLTNCLLSKHYDDVREKFKVARERGEAAFREAVKEWGPMDHEPKLTDDLLLKQLQAAIKDIDAKIQNHDGTLEQNTGNNQGSQDSTISTTVKAAAQTRIIGVDSDGTLREGKIDNLLWERDEEDESIAIPITILEIGKSDKYDFWQKASRGHDYVKMLRNPPSDSTETTKVTGDECANKIAFNKHPILLSCIVLASTENGEAHGEFGTFLCIPVQAGEDQDGDFRTILLHRTRIKSSEPNGLEKMSKAFGKILEASLALREWRKGDLLDSYEYLGPNCARIGDRLYRSYDTRLRCTDRSPDLYLWPEQQNGGQTAMVPSVGFHWYPSGNGTEIPDSEAAIKVIDISDAKKDDHGGGEDEKKDDNTSSNKVVAAGATDRVHLFGEELPKDVYKLDWLWGDQGRLLVISVPFRGGDHRARKLSDFIPILDHLTHLHTHGMVHGDIRAFNMVFDHGDEAKLKGWLIDLDFGGREGSVKYPQNFNFIDLKDGRRIGEPGELIQKYHDYYALWQVINQCHVPDTSEVEDGGKFLTDVETLKLLIAVTGKANEHEKMQYGLSDYLKKWGHVPLRTDKVFSRALEKQNAAKLNEDQGAAQGDMPGNATKTNPADAKTNPQVATGSPRKV